MPTEGPGRLHHCNQHGTSAEAHRGCLPVLWTSPLTHVSFEDGTIWNRHGDHLRLAQTGAPLTSAETNALHPASAAASPQLKQPPLHAPAVPDVPHEEQPPGTSFSGSSCAMDSDVTAVNSGVCVKGNSVTATPSTPKSCDVAQGVGNQ